MKEIKAIVRPFRLLHIITALQKIENLRGVTISDIRGFGKSRRRRPRKRLWRGLLLMSKK